MKFCLILFASIFAATSPTIADEPKGTCFLVGGGKLPSPVREKFFQLAGGKEAKLVVIPTASESADDKNADEIYLDDWKKLSPKSLKMLHTRDRKKADEATFVQPLKEASAVWFSGGDQSRVTAVYLGTAVDKELKALLRRDGIIGGTSAGTAIMSQVMIAGGKDKAELGTGFGFLDWCIADQHFVKRDRQKRLLTALDAHPGLYGLGVDESTAAIVRGRTVEVLGDSTVTLIEKDSKYRKIEVLKPGERRVAGW